MTLTRRRFIQTATAAGSSLLLPACASITTPRTTEPRAVSAMADSLRNFGAAIGGAEVRFDRALPAGLEGTLYRNGPARMQRGATTYAHWFDGDGMVQALRLKGATLEHRGALVDTDRSRAESAAGRFLWPGFGTTFDGARSVRKPDDVNVANISVLPLGGELLALWEGGSAWRLDPDTLRTRGRKVFDADTDGASFSAHPRVDPDGRVWNFGWASGSGKLLIYDIDRSGALKRHALIDAPNADMVHDFAVTARHLVFVLTPVLRKTGARRDVHAFTDSLAWHPDKPVWLLVVDKDTLEVTHRAELPNFFCFHLGNAWLDGPSSLQTLRVEVVRAAPFDVLMAQIATATRGAATPRRPAASPIEVALDLRTGRVRTTELPLPDAEFPRFDPRRTGVPTRHLLALGFDAQMPAGTFGHNTAMWFDRERGRVATFSYGARAFAEEHVFVPRADRSGRGREGEGWILGTALDWQARRTIVCVFDAQALDAGPIATARLPYTLPMGLHGQFVAAA